MAAGQDTGSETFRELERWLVTAVVSMMRWKILSPRFQRERGGNVVAFDYMEGGGTREKVTLGSRKTRCRVCKLAWEGTELYAREAVAEEMGEVKDGFYRIP